MPLLPYLRLMRPANIITALADIILGFAIAGGFRTWTGEAQPGYGDLAWLLLSTAGLYGGGVVLNDVFDYELDRVERPERPIPRGQASLRGATFLGIVLLLVGIAAAAQVSGRSLALAWGVALLAVLYDAYGKHHSWLGPINMGACRGGNLLLGMSVLPLAFPTAAVALVPFIYIATITFISRGEVGGASRHGLYYGAAGYGLTLAVVIFFAGMAQTPWWMLLPFVLVFGGLVFPPLLRAINDPSGPQIGRAVHAGVIALIALDAALAAAMAGWPAATLILALLPFSVVVGRFFAVT